MEKIITIDDNLEYVDSLESLFLTTKRDVRYKVFDEIRNYCAPFQRIFSNEAMDIIQTGGNSPLNRRTGASFLEETLSIPSLEISKLSNAYLFGGKIRSKGHGVHTHGQLCLRENFSIFNESYGIMDGEKTLSSLLVPYQSENQYILKNNDGEPVFFKGTYFLIGNAHDHFGHFLVEGLARLWALKFIPIESHPEIKFVIYENGLMPSARRILEYLGIDKDRLIYCPDFAQFENIYIPSIGMRTHWWCHEAMNFVYDAIAQAAVAEKSAADYSKKILLSRADVQNRKLVNREEFERFFVKKGYAIIKPESLPIGDQIRMSHSASEIVGCTGSQMYLALFQKAGGKNIVFTPWNFSLKDDAIISKVRNSALAYVLGSSTDADGCWHVSIPEHILENGNQNE